VITKYLEGVDLLNKGISFTPSLSTIMLLDLQIQELRILIPLVNLTMHSLLIYFQEMSHHYEINKYFTMECTSSLFEIQFTLFNPSKIKNMISRQQYHFNRLEKIINHLNDHYWNYEFTHFIYSLYHMQYHV